MNILVTGGAGYIGSHAALRLLDDGHRVTVIDNLSRGNLGAIEVLRGAGDVYFQEADVADRAATAALLRSRAIELVMHFAALTYVGESVDQPLRYYRNNVGGGLGLLEAMDEAGVARLIFSSTCAVYGEPHTEAIPIRETCFLRPINPYGRSKLFMEEMMRDHALRRQAAGEAFAFAALRYFNVAGCDGAGRLGEDHDPETHLVPICLDAALGRRAAITVFGADYDTPDGTCIRDYVHVEDLVDAHVAAMNALGDGDTRRYNVGIGRGYSVREVIEACRSVTGVDIPERGGDRRPGDPPVLYADPACIKAELGWRAKHSELETIIETAWRWRRRHPGGYAH